ncbi:MAG: hypothetical protein AB1633_12525 [Elusimicrobiota bacterium]
MDDQDFDRFLSKNMRMARGYDLTKSQEKASDRDGMEKPFLKKSCFNCRLKIKCNDFRTKRTGGIGGSVSIGDDSIFICDKWQAFEPSTKQKTLSDRQVKSMLKAATHGRL